MAQKITQKEIREEFYALLSKQKDSFLPYILDPKNPNSKSLVIGRRKYGEKWQFVALSYGANPRRFYVEIAISSRPDFPVNGLGWPHLPTPEGDIRFSAAELWGNMQSGGWIIDIPEKPLPKESLMPPEGVFQTMPLLMSDLEDRLKNWIIPFLENKRPYPQLSPSLQNRRLVKKCVDDYINQMQEADNNV
ncbi:MAG: hypothetical protein LBU87_04225 [Lactobacillales bacterium]|jgi:hypothetical protein|nr:hypothetical protein [Lactobacillales bacterium]